MTTPDHFGSPQPSILGAAPEPAVIPARGEYAPGDPRSWLSPPPAIRKVKRAIAVANTSAFTLALCAGISWIIVAASVLAHDISWSSAIVGTPLTAIAIAEFIGAARLRRLDLTGPRYLATNQVCLIGLVCAYCGWQMYCAMNGTGLLPSDIPRTGDPGMDQQMADMVKLAQPIMIGGYAILAILTAIFCGFHAWYYASRRYWVKAALALRSPAATSSAVPGAARTM